MADLGFNLPDCNDFETNPTLISRDSFDELLKFFEDYKNGKITSPTGKTVSQSVLNELLEVERRGDRNLSSTSNNRDWYGDRSRMREVSWRFLLERKEFVYRDIYDDFRNKMWDNLNRLLRQESIANIIKKNFEWNDRELGLFSFDRASLSLTPKYAYYSFLNKRTYQEELIDIIGKGEETKYILKSDGSEIKLCYEINLNEPNEEGETKLYIDSKKQIDLDEINKIGYLSVVSDIKNSFIYQTEKPKLANAIRIFIDFGCNANIKWEQKIYCGLVGVIISEFFEFMGYATSIVPYIGFRRNHAGNTVYRLIAYQAKKFSETLETEKLLLTCSDIAFFRTQFFLFAHLTSDYYDNDVYEGIGQNMDRNEKQCSIIQKFKNIDKNIDCHYINIADIYSEDDAIFFITYLIHNLANENKKLNEIRFGSQEKILTEKELLNVTRQSIEELNNPTPTT